MPKQTTALVIVHVTTGYPRLANSSFVDHFRVYMLVSVSIPVLRPIGQASVFTQVGTHLHGELSAPISHLRRPIIGSFLREYAGMRHSSDCSLYSRH